MSDGGWIGLGLNLQDMIAGFAGGVVNSFVLNKSKPMDVVASMICGALTANYLGEMASTYIGANRGAGTFIIGMSAMAVCQGIIEAARRGKSHFGGKP